MTGQILPGGLGGVGSGFVASPYSSNAALFGNGSLGLLDGLTGSAAQDALASSRAPTAYSAAATLYGPNLGLSMAGPLGQGTGFGYDNGAFGGNRIASMPLAGRDGEALLSAWDFAKKTAQEVGQSFVDAGKGLVNGTNAGVNGAFDTIHLGLALGEKYGVLPPGASDVRVPHFEQFGVNPNAAAQAGAMLGFAGALLLGPEGAAPAATVGRGAEISVSGGMGAIRETVLANVAESQAARASSGFDIHLARADQAPQYFIHDYSNQLRLIDKIKLRN
ncbi:hypothetical protein HDG34_001594 [Paraburkholderia sp. HC6.4b]|uniref:hypothetical protein n=1 Tax=unclassified Paraburkholderia TaxID=2615204 RepID=UPI00160A2B17|nr:MULTISPECIES: hypothetical protein [unclassified Paraburkholderia]MBB5407662.1 hypothetical protein [Paraburkholderia sp. HC6.4b]MBB5452325.1 hypothetical protein [Paraburkholderia sp. Kb1A]